MAQLDETFAALADPTRRAILMRLATGQATVGELMEPFDLSQPAISRHLKVLEKAGLVETTVQGTARPRSLRTEPLREVDQWLMRYRQRWDARFTELDKVLDTLQASTDPTRAKDGKHGTP